MLVNVGIISLSAQGFKPSTVPQGVVDLFESEYQGVSRYFVDSTLLKMQFSRFQRKIQLDSSQQIIEIRELLYDKDFQLPLAMDLEYYTRDIGLFKPVEIIGIGKGLRIFDRKEVVKKIKLVKKMQAEGKKLKEIKEYIDTL